MTSAHRVRALARRLESSDVNVGAVLDHLAACVDRYGMDPRDVPVPPEPPAWRCPGDDHRGGCPVSQRWHHQALRWVVDQTTAEDPTEPEPGPMPRCYRLWTRHWTPVPMAPLGRRPR